MLNIILGWSLLAFFVVLVVLTIWGKASSHHTTSPVCVHQYDPERELDKEKARLSPLYRF